MKTAVLLKRVPDTASNIKVSDDQKSILIDNPQFIMNPYDEYALEEALRIKESDNAEVILVCIDNQSAEKVILTGLSMGADSAVLVNIPDSMELSSRGISKIIGKILKELDPDIIFAGKEAVDDEESQIPERVAEILKIARITAITRFEFKGDMAEVDREIEVGTFTIEVPLPALFTMEKGINMPRSPTLLNIMKAKQKEIKSITLEDLKLDEQEITSGLFREGLSLSYNDRLLKFFHGDPDAQVQELLSVIEKQTAGI